MLSHCPSPVRLQFRAPQLLRQSFCRLLERLPRIQITGTSAPADVLLDDEVDTLTEGQK